MKGNQWRAVSLCAIAIVFAHLASAQDVRDFKQRIDGAMQRQDRPAAIAELKALQKADASSFAHNNYEYLMARLTERGGDPAGASAAYQNVITKRSVLSQYALWHLAGLARATGNLTLEREQLRRLVSGSPTSLLRPAASFRLGQSFFESGDYAAAIVALRPLSAPKVSSSSRAAMLLLAQAYLRSGQTQLARETFATLIAEAPDPSRPDDNALAAVRNLDELEGQQSNSANTSAVRLSEGERLRRAAIYQFNRDFTAARFHYQKLVADYPQSATVPDSMYQIGRGLFQEAKYEDAIKQLKQVQDQFPNSTSARDSLGLIAGAQNRLKQTDAALASYKLLIERYPNAPNPERPYLNIIDALREGGRDNEALEWAQRTRQRFESQTTAALALFSQLRIHLAQAAWPAVLEDADLLMKERDFGGTQTAGSTNANELAFIRAYALEQAGRTEEAIDAFLAIPDGRSEYYGGQSTLRLRALRRQADKAALITKRLDALRAAAQQSMDAGDAERARVAAQNALRLTEDEAVTQELLAIARRAYANIPAYNAFPPLQLVTAGRQELLTNNDGPKDVDEIATEASHRAIADELLFLGLYDEGTPELAASRAQNSAGSPGAGANTAGAQKPAAKISSPDKSTGNIDYTLAVFFLRGGNANQAMRFGQTLWKNIPRDYLLALAPRQLAELLYPAPYIPALLAQSAKRGIDPRFLLAIARQESGFLPEAKSVSAARGLMQFISATANDIALQVGKKPFRDDDLYDPEVSIMFGAQYLSNLFKRFPGMPQAVAASYNGGDENMARWIARARSNEPDRYVLDIGFAQSKDYVYRVMSNYRAYQLLYSDQFQSQ